MDYVALHIPVADDGQAEILTAELAEFPFESFESGDGLLKAYIPKPRLAECKDATDALLERYGTEGRYAVIEAQDWNAAWEADFTPVDVDGRVRIRAPFHDPAPEGVLEIVVSPRMAFGTGHHATTCLMVSALLDLDLGGRCGLDMGSGTGVLAILAAKRGAARVDAVDIDAWADANCRENAAANGVADRVVAMPGDVGRIAGRKYDFVLANINRNILLRDLPAYAAALRGGGDLLLSGFFMQDVPKIAARAAEAGFDGLQTRERDGWALVRCRRL